MKILSIQYGNLQNPYSHGGLSTLLHETFKRMVPRHQVTCLTGLIKGSDKKIMVDGVNYIQRGIGTNKYINRLSFFSRNLFFKDVKDYDLVLTPWDRYSPVLTSRFPGCPVILQLDLDFFNLPSKLSIVEPVTRYLLKKRLKKSPYIISNSNGVKETHEPYADQSVFWEIITPGVPGDIFKFPVDPNNEKYLLYLGRLDISHKGIDTLLEAYKLSEVMVPLVIAGDGVDRLEVERLIREHDLSGSVEMVGWVEGERKYELLSNSLAVCMPSRVEGWGIIATEAAAMGKPVIGTDVVGLRESVLHNKTGILVEKESTFQYAEVMKQMVRDRQLRRKLGKQARETARQFTWENITRKREAFFQKVITHHTALANKKF